MPVTSTAEEDWQLPPDPLVLAPDQVHLWRLSLEATPSTVERLYGVLCEGERARAERFYFEHDRQYFIVARGRLRQLLGYYLGRAAPALTFDYGPRGKPALAPGQGDQELCFNLSHSQGLALYAVAWGRRVGVDLEVIRSDISCQEIVERYFSPREQASFRQVPPSQQAQAFFHGWTRKEAFLKATGEGLSAPLDQVEVTLAPQEPAALVNIPWQSAMSEHWFLYEVNPAPGYVASLAVEGCDRICLRYWCGMAFNFDAAAGAAGLTRQQQRPHGSVLDRRHRHIPDDQGDGRWPAYLPEGARETAPTPEVARTSAEEPQPCPPARQPRPKSSRIWPDR